MRRCRSCGKAVGNDVNHHERIGSICPQVLIASPLQRRSVYPKHALFLTITPTFSSIIWPFFKFNYRSLNGVRSKFDHSGVVQGDSLRPSLSWHGWFPRGNPRSRQYGKALGIGAPGGILPKPHAEAA